MEETMMRLMVLRVQVQFHAVRLVAVTMKI
jgi:hypothetical protein